MDHALIIGLFVAGFVGKAVFDRYFGVRVAGELVVRAFLLPFYAAHLTSHALFQAALWFVTGENPQDRDRKVTRAFR